MQSSKQSNKWRNVLALLAPCVILAAGPVFAEAEVSLSKWLEKVKVKGDLRVRHESINKNGHGGDQDRHRQRFRLRVAADFALPHSLKVKTRFASGGGEQTSTNQSFDANSSQKEFWIDRAYLIWTPEVEMVNFAVSAGRMANPMWGSYSADLVWDTDINPEGLSEGVTIKLGGGGEIFLTLMQLVIDEDSSGAGAERDQFLFSEQLGGIVKLPMDTSVALAITHHEFVNEDETSLGSVAGAEGNRGGASLVNQFGVGQFGAEVKTKIVSVPVAFDVTAIKNFKHLDKMHPAMTDTIEADSGYQFGVRVGKASKKNTVEGAVYKKWVEADAMIDDIVDADFGDSGGTNRHGYLFWVAYAVTDWMKLKAKHFTSSTLDPTITLGHDSIQRTQLDLAVKF